MWVIMLGRVIEVADFLDESFMREPCKRVPMMFVEKGFPCAQ